MREKTLEDELAETLVQVGTTIIASQKCSPQKAMIVARDVIEQALRTARAMMEERAQIDQTSGLDAQQVADRHDPADTMLTPDPRAVGAALVRERAARYER